MRRPVAAGAPVRQNGALRATGVIAVDAATPGRGYISGLTAGIYTVTVSLPGYAMRTFTDVVITAEGITPLNAGTTISLVPIA